MEKWMSFKKPLVLSMKKSKLELVVQQESVCIMDLLFVKTKFSAVKGIGEILF